MTQGKTVAVALLTFVLGISLSALVFWNPLHWAWAERAVGRLHGHAVSESAVGEGKSLWTCGMHPQVIQNEPGNCPICGMRLVPVKDGGTASGDGATAAGKEDRKVLYWRAPMDPNYISDKPGKSPMGMDLIPVYAGDEKTNSLGGGIRVDPGFLQNFAVRTAMVERGSIPLDIRTVGILEHNPARLVAVNTKFDGWIEKSYINNIGEQVKRGDLLFEIYSPQLVTTQQEFLATAGYVKRLSTGAYPEAIERAQTLLEAARERLRYWDVTDEQISEVQRNGKPQRTLQFFSPATGHLMEKVSDSLEGTRLMPDMTVLKLADHTRLWVKAELYEDQLRHVRIGTPARVEVDAFPGRRWSGKVVLFDSAVDPMTRTLKAFIEIDNGDRKLVPMMYATVTVLTPAVSNAVKVPQEAVLHSGERSVVIVQKTEGLFEPREVELGPSGGGEQEIRKGLQPGEIVVTSSQFLIDSESNLKAAIQQLLGGGSRTATPIAPTEHQH